MSAKLPAVPSPRSLAGLRWFNFCVAGMQVAFGPFIAIRLAEQGWMPAAIGFVLSAEGVASLVSQIPGGHLVDSVRAKRLLAASGVALVALSALILALSTQSLAVLIACVLQGATGGILGTSIAAMALGLAGHAALSRTIGLNQRYASAGAMAATAAMGTLGALLDNWVIFLAAAMLAMPAFAALGRIRSGEIDHDRARGAAGPTTPTLSGHVERELSWNGPLLTFAGCAVLFHLANASALILVGVNLVFRGKGESALIMAALMVFPQVVTVLIAPWLGRQAERWGRKPLLLIGFAILPVRVMLLSTTTDPTLLILIQLLDGVGGVVMGMATPLVIADMAGGSGRYNLAQGIYGTVIGVGVAGSRLLAGLIAEFFSLRTGLVVLAAIALAGAIAIALLMPETKPGAASAPGRTRAGRGVAKA